MVPLDVQHPSAGTLIRIEKGDIFKGAGDVPCTKAQAEVLCAKVDPADVRILPDTGSLYLPWSWYAHRLTQAFGPMGWSLLPIADEKNNPTAPVCKDNVMYREFVLKADGRFVASALGECAYRPNNARMTFGDAVEGARSNALSRCCKSLGMAPEIYSDGWREDWTRENAVCVVAIWSGKQMPLWRRKNAIALKGEQGHANPPCPCENCAKGLKTMAPDGRPTMTPPTSTDAPPIEAEFQVAQGYKVLDVIEKTDPDKKKYWDIVIEGPKGKVVGYTRKDDEASVASSAKRTDTRVLLDINTRGKHTEFKAIEPILEGGSHGK